METKPIEDLTPNNPLNNISKVMKVIANIFFGATVFIIMLLVFSIIQNKATGGSPNIAGYQMYIVLSGSMNPEFNTGSLVILKPMKPAEIRKGDIITFKGSGDNKSLTTHRVVEIDNSEPNNIKFTTKGDANKVNDPNPVLARNLVGKVTFAIPYLGYIMSFGQTKQGLLLLIIIPGALLLITEIHKLYKNIIKLSSKDENIEEKSQA